MTKESLEVDLLKVSVTVYVLPLMRILQVVTLKVIKEKITLPKVAETILNLNQEVWVTTKSVETVYPQSQAHLDILP